MTAQKLVEAIEASDFKQAAALLDSGVPANESWKRGLYDEPLPLVELTRSLVHMMGASDGGDVPQLKEGLALLKKMLDGGADPLKQQDAGGGGNPHTAMGLLNQQVFSSYGVNHPGITDIATLFKSRLGEDEYGRVQENVTRTILNGLQDDSDRLGSALASIRIGEHGFGTVPEPMRDRIIETALESTDKNGQFSFKSALKDAGLSPKENEIKIMQRAPKL